MGTTIYEQALRRLAYAWGRYNDRFAKPKLSTEPEPIRGKGQLVSFAVYKEVKHSLKLVGRMRGYETVKAVADMHNIGRTTAYKIKATASYGEYTGRAKRLEIKSSSRAYKVPVHTA